MDVNDPLSIRMRRIRRLLQEAKPMTELDRREQLVSLVHGNTHLSNPNVTREMVESEVKK